MFTAELFDTATGAWLEGGVPAPPPGQERCREYHSSAILLPDGRVLVAGGDSDAGECFGRPAGPSAQIYQPGYRFRDPPPVIGELPSTAMTYGFPFAIPTADAGDITGVLLVRPGSVTHSINTEQRVVPLGFAAREGIITALAPEDSAQGRTLAPPGWYLLFLVKGQGEQHVPSEARFIKLAGPQE